MTTERFMIDDAGTLIDMQTRDVFDIVEEVVDLLNELNQEAKDNEHYHTEVLQMFKAISKEYEKLLEENEELKKEVEMLRTGLKAYDEALPLYLDCEDIMHFNNSELFEFKMERMDFYKKYPNRVHYKCGDME